MWGHFLKVFRKWFLFVFAFVFVSFAFGFVFNMSISVWGVAAPLALLAPPPDVSLYEYVYDSS